MMNWERSFGILLVLGLVFGRGALGAEVQATVDLSKLASQPPITATKSLCRREIHSPSVFQL